MYILLSNSRAGPGRTVKQEQEEISRNHVQTFFGSSVQGVPHYYKNSVEKSVEISTKLLNIELTSRVARTRPVSFGCFGDSMNETGDIIIIIIAMVARRRPP